MSDADLMLEYMVWWGAWNRKSYKKQLGSIYFIWLDPLFNYPWADMRKSIDLPIRGLRDLLARTAHFKELWQEGIMHERH